MSVFWKGLALILWFIKQDRYFQLSSPMHGVHITFYLPFLENPDSGLLGAGWFGVIEKLFFSNVMT